MTKPFSLRISFAALLLTSCATAIQVQDVIDLPPPAEVRGERIGERITIKWKTGIEVRAVDFAGYFLYFAPYSLAVTPLDEMPSPVAVPPGATEYSMAVSDSLPRFIHLRSRAGKRKLSLPSVPELAVRSDGS